MNEAAERIYHGMREMTRGQSRDITKRHELRWCGLLCVYYPTSNTFNWFGNKQVLSKREVISLINIQLGETDELSRMGR